MEQKNDKIKVLGTLQFHKNGVLIREEKNLVVDVGLNLIANRLKDAALGAISHMSVGTGTTAADHADTALGTPIAPRLVPTSVTVTNGVISTVATFSGATYAGSITEAGLFNHLSAGQMLSRVVFTAVPIGATDSLQITWALTFANA